METPDITPIQVRAVLLWVFSALALVGLGISDAVQEQIVVVVTGFLITVLPVALVIADAIIRRARANNVKDILTLRELYGSPASSYIPAEGDAEE